MLEALGLDSLEALQDKAVLPSIVSAEPMVLPPTMGERETLTYLRRMRDRNEVFISMIGLGYYGTILPGVIKRNVLENSVHGLHALSGGSQSGAPGSTAELPADGD